MDIPALAVLDSRVRFIAHSCRASGFLFHPSYLSLPDLPVLHFPFLFLIRVAAIGLSRIVEHTCYSWRRGHSRLRDTG